MNRKNPAQRLMIVREHLNRLYAIWLAKHGAWNADKMMGQMEQELKARRRSGSYAGPATPLCLSGSGPKTRKKGGV